MDGRRISAGRATIWMAGRKTSGYGSFRLGKGLIKRTEHRPLFGPAIKMMSPAGFTGGCILCRAASTAQIARLLLLVWLCMGPCPRAAVAGLLGGIQQLKH